MQDKDKFNPLAVVLGTTFVISLASGPVVNAANNPFNMIDLGSGYMVAEEGSCGDKKEEGKCGEGKCGDKHVEGSSSDKKEEGKCGDKK